jgi:hypothetical protein
MIFGNSGIYAAFVNGMIPSVTNKNTTRRRGTIITELLVVLARMGIMDGTLFSRFFTANDEGLDWGNIGTFYGYISMGMPGSTVNTILADAR